MIGRDACGGVVRGPVVVGHGEPAPAESVDDLTHERIAGEGKPGPAQAVGAYVGVRKSHERVQRRTSRVTVEDVEAEGPGHMGDDCARHGLDGSRSGHHGAVGRSDDQEVDASGRTPEVVVAAKGALDVPPGGGQRPTQ